MNGDCEQEISEIMDAAAELPHGPTEIGLIERAIRIADAHERNDLGFMLRKRLMQSATFGGAPEKALLAFTWCIAQCDRNPDEFDSGELLWEYKWVVSSLKHFPGIPLDRIEAAFAEMATRYESHGLSLRPIHKLRCMFAMFRGDLDGARQWQKEWRHADAGFCNDCDACELHDQVEYFVFVGKLEKALEKAGPILRGRLKCAEIPHLTYAKLLHPCLQLGMLEEAESFHRRGYHIIAHSAEFLASVGDHMHYLGLAGKPEAGLPILEKHFNWALETSVPSRRFVFDKGALCLLRACEKAGQKEVTLSLPKQFPEFQTGGKYATAELAAWFEADARAIAELFDNRNGTDSFAKQIDEVVA